MKDFDKAFYINLARRADRDKEFRSIPDYARLCERWKLERFEGVDEEPPKEFARGRGVWGCYQSHLRILEEFRRHEEWQNVFIFEDDALPCNYFLDVFHILDVPDDWSMLYLGGQALENCYEVPGFPKLLHCENVNRTHAYAVSRRNLDYIIAALKKPENLYYKHVDSVYGLVHPYIDSYLVKDRLVFQRAGLSDINLKKQERRLWSNQFIIGELDVRRLTMKITIDAGRSNAGWGAVALNDSGAKDFAMKLANLSGDKLYAHANSTVFAKFENDVYLQGALNGDCRPVADCEFYVNGVKIGTIKNNRLETPLCKVPKSDVWTKLEIKANKIGGAHTLWRVLELDKLGEKNVALCACAVCRHDNTNRLIDAATNCGLTIDKNLFVDQEKTKINVPARINALIQNAINNGADVVALSEVNAILNSDFLKLTQNVYPGNGLVLTARELDEEKLNEKNENLDGDNHIAAIAFDVQDWIKLNVPNEPVSVRELIKSLYNKFDGTFVKLNSGVFAKRTVKYEITEAPKPLTERANDAIEESTPQQEPVIQEPVAQEANAEEPVVVEPEEPKNVAQTPGQQINPKSVTPNPANRKNAKRHSIH